MEEIPEERGVEVDHPIAGCSSTLHSWKRDKKAIRQIKYLKLLANIYLHYVLDDWFAQTVQPRMQGRCSLTRFADDFVMVFENHDDCRRVEKVLPKRLKEKKNRGLYILGQ